MRRKDNARLETLQRAVMTLEEHQTMVNAYKPLKALYAKLKALTDEIADNRMDSDTPSEGLTSEKRYTLELVIKQSVSLAKLAQVWAKLNNPHMLIPEFELEKADFKSNVLDGIDKARRLEASLRPLLEDLEDYEITEAKLDLLKLNIENLQTVNPKPRHARNQNKLVKEKLREDIRDAMELARDIENVIVGHFVDSEPDFVNRYLASMRIYDPATRSTGVQLVVLDQNGQPIDNAECDILELEGEEQRTNHTGYALIEGIRSGTFTLEIRKEGFRSSQRVVEIKRGKKISLDLKLDSHS